MKNWKQIVAGLLMLASLGTSSSAQAYAVNVGVSVVNPMPIVAPMPMPMPTHSYPGFYPGAFPPPVRPYCGPVMYPSPYMYPMPYYPVGYCYPWRRPYKRFSFALRIGGFGLAINTGSGYY